MARAPIVGRRFLWILSLFIAATCLAMGAALLHELSVASHTVNDFGQDERREQAHITHGAQVTLDERLRPLYLKRYGLDPSQYTDSHGHFSLTGAD